MNILRLTVSHQEFWILNLHLHITVAPGKRIRC
jgi:hypothetical protein